MFESANIFMTGGAGTLGRAIARRRKEQGWKGKFTVYSTDEHKHALMRAEFPDINFVQGDIRNGETLYAAMIGHDIVIHAAAVKVIPVSEFNSIDTYDVNVFGSQMVCSQAVHAGIQHVLGISTDKACHPANAYGCSKMMMEKIFQEYARSFSLTSFHLVRYGNVLESTGSVIETWNKAIREGLPIRMTDPEMTRFWLSPSQAVDCALKALEFDSGMIYIPKLPALSIGKLAEYTVSFTGSKTIAGRPIEKIPLRPGEKMHETLLTDEECWYSAGLNYGSKLFAYILHPTTHERSQYPILDVPYTSLYADRLTQADLLKLLQND